jgi:2-polyprenyl-3-methyl-5-hydroxy-6-metoxy-1,4-benzoquinol methylase
MEEQVIRRLLELNQDFYERLSEPFAQSRTRPQPGFSRLTELLSQPCHSLLDVGCGDGRFGRFLQSHGAGERYVGVDFSDKLLAKAAAHSNGIFHLRDLSQPGCLEDLGRYDAVSCLAVLQHIPGRANRLQLLLQMKACMAPGGLLFLSTWQFRESERLRSKIREWSEIGLEGSDVEPDDHLLTWQRGGFSYRYVALIDRSETEQLAREAGLRLVKQFRSDGKEGNLSLYSVFSAP